MSRIATALLVAILATQAIPVKTANAQHSSRQYYGGWHAHSGGYHYRSYYYKPHAQFSGFKHHYVIHHPRFPQHLYFYNPYQKKFWGRCPVDHGGKPVYSLLAEKDRNGDLDKIPESAFPKPGPVPEIPESTDGAKLDLPPDDLPDISALPAGDKK